MANDFHVSLNRHRWVSKYVAAVSGQLPVSTPGGNQVNYITLHKNIPLMESSRDFPNADRNSAESLMSNTAELGVRCSSPRISTL